MTPVKPPIKKLKTIENNDTSTVVFSPSDKKLNRFDEAATKIHLVFPLFYERTAHFFSNKPSNKTMAK